MAAVVGVVVGGVAAVNAVANRSGSGEATNTALTSTNLPAPTAEPSATEEPTPAATEKPKKTKTTEAAADAPVRTRTVTKEADPTATSKPKKSGKQTEAGEKKAKKAAAEAEATPGTTVQRIGVVRNLVTGYCVDLSGTGAVSENVLVVQNDCVPGKADNQAYETVTQADGTFLLRNVKSQWCLDVNGSGNVEPGIVVNTHTCLLGDQDNQMFKKQAQGDGFFLVHVKSGLCLDVSNENNGQTSPGAKLTLFTCSAEDDHVWSFS
nr:RICIN domain-containing protein [Kineosporia babensis]